MSSKKCSAILPLGFAEQVLDLEVKLEEEDESLELIQILSTMYKVKNVLMQIGIEYYLQHDIKRANYFQKKLNKLAVQSLQVQNLQHYQPAKRRLCRQVKEQTQKLNSFNSPYIQSIVNQSQKSQKKIQDCVLADLNRQQQRFQNRMLKRIRSAGKL